MATSKQQTNNPIGQTTRKRLRPDDHCPTSYQIAADLLARTSQRADYFARQAQWREREGGLSLPVTREETGRPSSPSRVENLHTETCARARHHPVVLKRTFFDPTPPFVED
jgi:hypothetical protein